MRLINNLKRILRLALAGVIAIVPLGLIWLYTIYGCMLYIDEEYPYTLWNKKFCQNNNNGAARVLVLGDSVINGAMVKDYLSDDVYNLSLGGVTTAEMYYIFKEYLENNPVPEVCYIGFSDQSYFMDQNLFNRCLYFHRFSKKQEDELFANAEIYQEQSILKEDYDEERRLYRRWSFEKYLPALTNGGIFMRYRENKANLNLVTEHNGSWISWTDKISTPGEESVYESFPVGEFEMYYMQRILDLCVENEITPRIVMIPMNPDAVCTIDYIGECYKFFVNLQNYCPQVTYLYRPEGFGYEDFADIWHMNRNGAEKYAKVLKETFPEDF